MGNKKNGKYLNFEEAREFVRRKKFKSRRDLLNYLKSNNIKNIPSNPDYVYKENWISLDDWLGRPKKFYKNVVFLDYNNAEKKIHSILKEKNIDSKPKWLLFYEESLKILKDIPKHPQIKYKNKGWVSWAKWLNIEFSPSDKKNHTLEEVKKIIKDNNIKTTKEYYKICKLKKIPTDPISKYKLNSWSDILCKKEKTVRKKCIDYESAKKIVHKLNLKSQKEWYSLSKDNKIPENIPKTPNSYYDEWISWNDWLGHNVSTFKKFLSYNKAKEYLSKIGLTSIQEYIDHIIENNIDFLPLQPQSYYGSEYKSINDFLNLGLSKIPYGEKKIIKILEEKNINYIHQHKFDDCTNINKLIFDFYLPDKNICIEFDGKQHFEPIDFFGGQEAFDKLKIRDKIKNDYCFNKNIQMIRISYEDINIIGKIIKEKV